MTIAFPFQAVTRATTAPKETPSTDDAPPRPLPSEISNLGSTELAEVKSEIPSSPHSQIANRNSQISHQSTIPSLPTAARPLPTHSPTDHQQRTTDILIIHNPISEKKLQANRANAQKSTGPRTPAGKQTSAQNALKHGLRAQTYFDNPPAKTHLCHEESNHPAECGATYATFEYELEEELNPITILQKSLFKQIATLAWRIRRLPHTEQEIFARLTPQPEIPIPQSQIAPATNAPHSQITIRSLQSEISNLKSQIPPSPHSQIANRTSQISTTDNQQLTTDTQHSSLSTQHLKIPPPCQTLADIFCTAQASNPFTLFNRYERSLQNAYLRLLRHYDHLKKHHPHPHRDHSDPLPPEPAWRPPAPKPNIDDEAETDNTTFPNEPL